MTSQTKLLPCPIKEAYDKGYIDGVTCFAWHGKKCMEVGTSGLSLGKAIEKRKENYNYTPPNSTPSKVTMNRNKLAKIILDVAVSENVKDNPESRKQCFKLADAIIAFESEILEVKNGN